MPPPDTRRISGPESSVDYRLYSTKKKEDKPKNQRTDGRSKDDEHRPVFMKTGVISQAKGSAYLEQGNTKVICGIYGPREIPKRSDFSMKGILFCSMKHAAFASSTRRTPGIHGTGEAEDKELSHSLKEALEATVALHLYPKSQIDVHVMVLENAGSVLAASLTCAGLALADAGINMFDTLIGASSKRLGDRCLTDPSVEEEDIATNGGEQISRLTIGYQPSLEQTVQIIQEGNISAKSVLMDLEHLAKVSSELSLNVQNCLVNSVKEKAANKNVN